MKPEVSHPTEACPEPELWTCVDDQATELEVLELLTALVVALKPRMLIETGCYDGWGTLALARGCQRNHFGSVFTCDVDKAKTHTTYEVFKRQGMGGISIMTCTGKELIERLDQIDFAFLDSGADEVRCEELKTLMPKLSRSGVVVVHDVGIQHGLRPHFFETVRELGLEFITLDTPRGLALVRKPWGK